VHELGSAASWADERVLVGPDRKRQLAGRLEALVWALGEVPVYCESFGKLSLQQRAWLAEQTARLAGALHRAVESWWELEAPPVPELA
jgi:hypothetical protein